MGQRETLEIRDVEGGDWQLEWTPSRSALRWTSRATVGNLRWLACPRTHIGLVRAAHLRPSGYGGQPSREI